MGRLPPLGPRLLPLALGFASVSSVGCDPPAGSGAPSSRSEQVAASGAQSSAAGASGAGATPAASAAAHAAVARTTKLCDGDANAKGRALAKAPFAHVEAAGAPKLDGTLQAPRGQWTWVNFWAAWCGPCKEEMPRLLAWQNKLTAAGALVRFVFVSLDDDERQLQAFLDRQPEGGVKSSLWLPDGASRTAWLSSLRLKSAPELPEQMLLDPSGHVRCFVEGAVDDGDYAEIAGILSR